MSLASARFYKMSGSGNDFVVFDWRRTAAAPLSSAHIRTLCARGTGIGADGVVILDVQPDGSADFAMRYYNRDGSRAALCGNAALCVVNLAIQTTSAAAGEIRIATDSGVLAARVTSGAPEVDLQPVREVLPTVAIGRLSSEQRIGYAMAGVPHLVVACSDIETADVAGRGAVLRRDPSLTEGANVNFVAPERGGAWGIRTYERGVEAETLACGTGAIASAILLASWGEIANEARLRTRSGRTLMVRLRRRGDEWLPSLSGEGRLVFTGELADALE
jgi:diaminopimelate epimerase